MNVPENLLYTKSHEWIQMTEDGKAVIGLTDHAQHELGDIVFLNLPDVGDGVETGEPLCDVESVKAVSDVFSPVTGVIDEVNETLTDSPELINNDPYGAWIVKVSGVTDKEELLTALEYSKLIG